MKAININWRSLKAAILLSFAFSLFGIASQVFAHGGEDHGDAKPKVATTEKGIVSRSTRLGDFEVTFKTPALEPDTGSAARLFITKFETNEAFGGAAVPAMEIESSGGAVTQAAVEKTDVDGSYNLKIPALPEGNYTVRASLKTAKGSNTATFSNVEVAHPATDAANGGAAAWFGTALLFFVGAIVLGLFTGLFYYYFRKWSHSALIGKIYQILYEKVRIKENREVSPSLGLVDSQSVKTASVTEEKGLDANKKINGRKRFVVTDTLGWIIGLMVVAASVQETCSTKNLNNLLKVSRLTLSFSKFFKI